jgi:predicted alpha/beta-fold hydrolase
MLGSPHLQSTLASWPLRRPAVERRARQFVEHSTAHLIDCGAGVRLLAAHTPPRVSSPPVTVIMIHGWEGHAGSMYMLSVGMRLWENGCRVVRLNLRDHGNSHHLNRGIFHSCRLDEAIGAVRAVGRQFPDGNLALVGFSLGGNFALRVAARAPEAGLQLRQVLAVCPVLDPRETMLALDRGLGLYRSYFMDKWRRSLERKRAAFPEVYEFGDLGRFRSLREMTEYLVLEHTEFPDLDSYLNGYAITGNRLAGLRVPCEMLLADDDPVIPVGGLARVARSSSLTVTRSLKGGHCGFLQSYGLQSWLDEYASRRLLRGVLSGG